MIYKRFTLFLAFPWREVKMMTVAKPPVKIVSRKAVFGWEIYFFLPNRTRSGTLTVNRKYIGRNMLTFALQKECPENFYESGSRWIEIWLTWHSNKAYESAHLLVHVLLFSKEVFFLLIIICEKNKQILEIWSRVSKCFSFTVSLFSYILGWLSLAVSNWGSTLWCLIEDMLQ